MDAEQLLKIAETAALAAGKRLAEGAEEFRKITFEDRNDVKLRADTESEALIRRMLAEGAPGLPIIGEEEGGDASLTEQDQLFWVVDPLDGTFNYLRGLPQCAVSIGLLRGTEPVLGVVYNFNFDQLYSGGPEVGFFLNGEANHYGWADERQRAVLATGIPQGMDRSDESMIGFVREMAPYKKVRMVGSAALALAFVASGQMDVYHEKAIRL